MIMNKIDLEDKVVIVTVAAYDLKSGRARY
jgi:hypothetical protein